MYILLYNMDKKGLKSHVVILAAILDFTSLAAPDHTSIGNHQKLMKWDLEPLVHLKYASNTNPFNAGAVFRRHNLTTKDVRI